MKLWILLILALVLILWSSREGFNPATQRPETTDTSLRRVVQSMAGSTDNTLTDGYIASLQKFYDTKYLPEKKTPEPSVVQDFVNAEEMKPQMTKEALSRIIEYVFLSTSAPPPSSTTSGTTTTGTTSGTTATGTTAGTTTPGGAMTTGSAAGTGGSSTTSFGPTSGNRKQQVFGPASNGRGEDVRASDSWKTKSYPELLGGDGGKTSTRVEGAGLVSPSQNWQLTMGGTLPSSASLGSDANSQFFPYSRQPGDMELIPDPYRVSQQFSAASYSFKTEPTPFLTDFSAFLK